MILLLIFVNFYVIILSVSTYDSLKGSDFLELSAIEPQMISMYQTNGTISDVSMAVLDQQLEMMNDLGAGIVSAMEQSVNPSVGGNIDIRL